MSKKDTTIFFKKYWEDLNDKISFIASDKLTEAASCVLQANEMGKKIIVVGNGGSAAMASHVTVDFTKAAGIRAVNFNEADLLTCLANDYGYKHWVEKALEFYADRGDLVILISSSGKSPNMINGVKKAKDMGVSTITFSGFSPDNPLRKIGDLNFWVDSTVYNIVEMTHHVWLVAIVDYLIETRKQV